MDINDFLSKTFLFKNIDKRRLSEIISDFSYVIKSFPKGQTIICPNDKIQFIGFIISGECDVFKLRNENEKVYLNTLAPHSSFGILSIFDSKNSFPTEIITKKASEILLISKKEFLKLIKNNSCVSMNTIEFLAERVAFLNKKIGTFSSKTVEEKLADYILEMSTKCNSFTFSATKLSQLLNAGRASIYRILESFSERGLIEIDNKTIIIKNKNKLKEVK